MTRRSKVFASKGGKRCRSGAKLYAPAPASSASKGRSIRWLKVFFSSLNHAGASASGVAKGMRKLACKSSAAQLPAAPGSHGSLF